MFTKKICSCRESCVKNVPAKPFVKGTFLQKKRKRPEMKKNFCYPVWLLLIEFCWCSKLFQNDKMDVQKNQTQKIIRKWNRPDINRCRCESNAFFCPTTFFEGPRVCFWRPKNPISNLKKTFWNCSFEDSIVVSTPYNIFCDTEFTCLRQVLPFCIAVLISDKIFCVNFYVASYFGAIFVPMSPNLLCFSLICYCMRSCNKQNVLASSTRVVVWLLEILAL